MRIGLDLLSLTRFARIAEHPQIRVALFTPAELAQADGLGRQRYIERLAGRFCAKEAVCKVLGRGFGQGLGWLDIQVTNDSWGAPQVTLSGGARCIAEQAGLREVSVTLSHSADLVIALAVGVGVSVSPAAPAPRMR